MSWATSNRNQRLPRNWQAIRQRILRRDGFACVIKGSRCTVKATEVDHIDAGDNHVESNLQSVCSECHQAKTTAEAIAGKARIRSLKKNPRRNHHPGKVAKNGREGVS